jgi:pilus assembly protein Flp/PilA
MKTLFLLFAKDNSGATAVECGLVASLVAVVLVGGASLLRMKV